MTGEDQAAVDAEITTAAAALDADAALLTAISTRAAALRSAAAAASTDRTTAAAAAAAETARAASVEASTPVASLAYVTAIRNEVAAIHTMLAEIYSWRAQIDAGYALAVTSTADLATVVATKL